MAPPRRIGAPVAAVQDTAAAVAADRRAGKGTAADTGKIGEAAPPLALRIPERKTADRVIVLHAAIAAGATATAVRLGAVIKKRRAIVPLPQKADPTPVGL